ncbi:unnamed protein product [Trichobilharzia regenti]|nr:unnamed protein product [Trichobilharzia regenti]
MRKIRTQNNAKSKFLYRRSDLIDSDKNDIIKMKAVLNHTALLPCRPDKKLLSENGIDENAKGTVSLISYKLLYLVYTYRFVNTRRWFCSNK